MEYGYFSLQAPDGILATLKEPTHYIIMSITHHRDLNPPVYPTRELNKARRTSCLGVRESNSLPGQFSPNKKRHLCISLFATLPVVCSGDGLPRCDNPSHGCRKSKRNRYDGIARRTQA